MRVVQRTLQATQAQLQKTEEELRMRNLENEKLNKNLRITHEQLLSVENSVTERVEMMSTELKKDLVQCQVALADSNLQKDEVMKELERIHQQFVVCSDAEYTRDCELKILSLNEQLEVMTGLLGSEKEGRMKDFSAWKRAEKEYKEKENEYFLQIEMLQKELLEKCNEIGEMHEIVNEAKETQEHYREAAESCFLIQEKARQREEEYERNSRVLKEECDGVKKRCIELINLKACLEKDVVRLRNEVVETSEREENERNERDEMKKEKTGIVLRCDRIIKEVREDHLIQMQKENKRYEMMMKEHESILETIQKEHEEERKKNQLCIREKDDLIQTWEHKYNMDINAWSVRYESKISEMNAEKENQKKELDEYYKDLLLKEQKSSTSRESALTSQYSQNITARLSEQRVFLQSEKEKDMSILEMKLVKQKETALEEQGRVYLREMEELKKKNNEIASSLEERAREESHRLVEKYEKILQEQERQRTQVITDSSMQIGDRYAKETTATHDSIQMDKVKEETLETLEKQENEDSEEKARNEDSLWSGRIAQLEAKVESGEKLTKEITVLYEEEKKKREEELKQSQEKIVDLKKKCLKLKAITKKLREKLPPEPPRKKSLHKSEKRKSDSDEESSSDSSLGNNGWNV